MGKLFRERCYTLNETIGVWEPQGVVIETGFWPMQEPQKMADGNWIMAGIRVSSGFGQAGNLPAVAISQGDDFKRWALARIIREPVAAFARTRGVSASCARVLANAATTVCHAILGLVNNPGWWSFLRHRALGKFGASPP